MTTHNPQTTAIPEHVLPKDIPLYIKELPLQNNPSGTIVTLLGAIVMGSMGYILDVLFLGSGDLSSAGASGGQLIDAVNEATKSAINFISFGGTLMAVPLLWMGLFDFVPRNKINPSYRKQLNDQLDTHGYDAVKTWALDLKQPEQAVIQEWLENHLQRHPLTEDTVRVSNTPENEKELLDWDGPVHEDHRTRS